MESVNEHLLRSLVDAQSKTPLEFLYLEAGAIPIRFILSSRRMIYQQTILKRNDEELTKRVYKAQSENPIFGDFYHLVKSDWEMIGETMNEEYIRPSNKNTYKKHIKKKIREAAFMYLKD